MADSTVAGDAHPILSNPPGRNGARGCIGLKIAAWFLAALVTVAAAGFVAAFFPRGDHRRGTRRLRRQRPWQRGWSGALVPAARQDDDVKERQL
ncbi:hypothetical protein [Actinomadura sp. 9N215]|uniref:hypothetical protein n=1 Tax=Actinomadura sp. 9N215 TaxID=3375150 RepID=UPI0037B77316